MSDKIGDMVRKECVPKYDISLSEVSETASSPDETHMIRIDGEELVEILEKRFEDHSLLALRIFQPVTTISFAVKFYADLASNIDTMDSLEKLESIARRFGFPIRIGQHTDLFILSESISMPNTGGNFVTAIMPPGRENAPGTLQSMINVSHAGRLTVIRCALAFCLDDETYARWLRSH